MIELYIFDIHEKYSYPLPIEVMNHINAYSNIERKNDSLTAYSHLVQILEEKGYDPSSVSYTEKGKAILDGIYFSISHSKNYVGIVISNTPVGVDIEEWIEEKRLHLSRRILTSREYLEYEFTMDKSRYLTQKWTLKEAYGKALGEGLSANVLASEVEGFLYELKDACTAVYPKDLVVVKEVIGNGKS